MDDKIDDTNSKQNYKIIKKLFNDTHDDYCKYFKDFQKRMDIIFKKKINDQEMNDIAEWFREYKNCIDCSKTIIDDFEKQIKSQSLMLSPERIKENDMFEEIKNKVMPIAIMYWMNLVDTQQHY